MTVDRLGLRRGPMLALARFVETPRVGLVLCLLPLVYVDNPIIRLTSVTDDSVLSYGPTAVMLALGFGAGVLAIVSGATTRRRYPLDWPIAALAGLTIANGVYGLVLGNSRFYVLDDLFQILEFCTFYFVVTTLVGRFDDITFALKVILVLTAACAITDFAVAFVNWNPSVGGFPRILPDGIRALPALILPVVAGALALAPRHRLWLGIAFGLMALWTVASLTRGLWASNVVALIVLLLVSRPGFERRRLLRGLGIAAAAIVLVMVPVALVARTFAPHIFDYVEFRIVYTPQQLLNPANRIEARRELEILYVATDLVPSPVSGVLGKGLGATYPGDTGYTARTLTYGDRHFIHDSYLAYWFRLGLPGLILYLLIAWRFGAIALEAIRKTPHGGLTAGLLAAYVGLLVYSITSDSLMRHPTGMFAAFAMAAVLIGMTANGVNPAESRLGASAPNQAQRTAAAATD